MGLAGFETQISTGDMKLEKEKRKFDTPYTNPRVFISGLPLH
jgi:hypothetical protein